MTTEHESTKSLALRLKTQLGLEFLDDGQLLKSTTLIHLAPGQVLFAQGEESKSCFLVISGSLKIVVKNRASETMLTILSKGEFGGALLMTQAPSAFPGSVIALSQASVLLIPKDCYLNQWMKRPETLNFINSCVRNRVRYFHEDRTLQSADVETRINHFFHRHYLEKKDLLTKKITRKEIAMAVGAKTETVIRVIKRLERAGVIKTQHSIISILNQDYILKSLARGA